MKKLWHNISLAALCLSIQGFSQSAIEIRYEDYNLDMDGIDLVVGNGQNGVPAVPQVGEDLFWDYSNFPGVDVANIHPWIAVQNCYSTENRSNPQGIGDLGNNVNWLYSYQEEGITAVGMHQVGAFVFLGNGGGLLWKDTCIDFPSEQYWVPFPLNYKDVWTRNVTEERPYSIEIPDVFEASDGYIQRFTSVYDSVSAWGTVRIPTSVGPQDFEVLLVEQIVYQQDSLFLNGEPAPDILLNAFNFVQGRSTLRRSYTFRSAENEVLYVIGTNFFGDHQFHAYLNDPLLSTATNTQDQIAVKLFPNPNSDGRLYLEGTNFESEVFKLNIWNAYGQLVHSAWTNNSFQQQFTLNHQLANGLYWLELQNKQGATQLGKSFVLDK